mgnify:CR=1 FL=1|tara:strand:- start:305 stop:1384 length:1080 start_codon:yes stop_codon:yes gene_type:complete
MIKVYQNYIIKSFSKIFLYVFFIFLFLTIILNIFEEVSFFKNTDVSLFFPFYMTLLNTPSVIYETFPFIFFIATQFFFIRLLDREELDIFKKISLSNTKLIIILSIFSLFLSVLIITIFYNLSSNLKFIYLDIKNKYSKDNKYLAVVTENGLWIRDEINGKINIINAETLNEKILENVSINQFSNDYEIIQNIIASKIDIENNLWIIKEGKFSQNNTSLEVRENYLFETNFNSNQISKLFSDLSSLNFIELNKIRKNYEKIGYTINSINVHVHKLLSYPFYLTIMTILGSIVMLNIKRNKSKIFHIIIGTLFSVLIYYISYFSGLLGQNDKLPLVFSIWLPLIIITLFCLIGLVRVNEK